MAYEIYTYVYIYIIIYTTTKVHTLYILAGKEQGQTVYRSKVIDTFKGKRGKNMRQPDKQFYEQNDGQTEKRKKDRRIIL